MIFDRVIDTTSMNTLALTGILLAMIKLSAGSVIFLVMARLLKIDELNSGPVRRILNRLHIPWL